MGDMADGAFQAKANTVLHGLRRVPAKRHRQPATREAGGKKFSPSYAPFSLNVRICAKANNLSKSAGDLQGGTHRGGQDPREFILNKVPDAEVVVHPYSGEAGAIGAGLVALDWSSGGRESAASTRLKTDLPTATSSDTRCHWCPIPSVASLTWNCFEARDGRGARFHSPQAGSASS